MAPLTGGTSSSGTGSTGGGGANTASVTPIRVVADAQAPVTMLHAAPGTLVSFSLSNTAPFARFARFYNTATMPDATQDPVWIGPFMLPASDTFTPNMPTGLTFTKGLAIAISAAPGDTDLTTINDNDVVGFVGVL